MKHTAKSASPGELAYSIDDPPRPVSTSENSSMGDVYLSAVLEYPAWCVHRLWCPHFSDHPTLEAKSKQRGDPAGSPMELSCPCCCTNSPSDLGACHDEPNRLRPKPSEDPACSLNGLWQQSNSDHGRIVPIPVPASFLGRRSSDTFLARKVARRNFQKSLKNTQ